MRTSSTNVTARTYLTAGIAALGVGALALSPVQPIPTQVALDPHRVVSDLGVDLLASSIDPITPWVQTFETAAANVGTLVEFYLQKPFPLLQTIGANIGTYFEELGNGNAGLIPEQIWGNIQTFFQAPWDPGAQFPLQGKTTPPTEVVAPLGQYLSATVPLQNGAISELLSPADANLTFLQLGASAGQNPDSPTNIIPWSFFLSFEPVWNFLNTNYSGQLLGLLGPLVSPLVQLTKSFTAVGEFFEAGDVVGAINELINIPANMTNAFLNGAGTLDLTGIFASIFDIPQGATVGANLGGLLNSMPVDGSLDNPDDPPTTWSGGTGFDSLAISLGPNLPSIPGLPNGWAGSVVGLGQFLGEAMLVTPPAPPPVAAEPDAAKLAAPEAAKQAAPLDIPAPVEEASPAVADVPAEESAPAVAEVVAEDPAPAVEDIAEIEAAVEAVEAPVSESAEAPAAEDSGPKPDAAESEQSDDNTGRAAGNTQRDAS
jgi:hypothetical protein